MEIPDRPAASQPTWPAQPQRQTQPRSALDGAALHSWARRAAQRLENKRAEINALNVFPVPDSDTGSNMAHTMAAAVKQADQLYAPGGNSGSAAGTQTFTAAAVSAALAAGAVRGARGNSGVVLSQVLRAVATTAGSCDLDGENITSALSAARSLVEQAIYEPVEGTVITVLRAAAIAAEQTSSKQLSRVAQAARDAAVEALHHTPSQLEVLRHAGVVDAGGAGLVELLNALCEEINGDAATAAAAPAPARSQYRGNHHTKAHTPGGCAAPAAHAAGTGQQIEVMYFLETDTAAALNSHLEELHPLGECVVLARLTDTAGTVHIHTNHAGEVIERAYAAGKVTDVRLEVLPAPADGHRASAAPTGRATMVLVLAQPGGIAQLFSAAGAVVINPDLGSPQEVVDHIAATIKAAEPTDALLLPNGQLPRREVLSATLAARAFGVRLTVVPTGALVNGVAAVAVHDATQPTQINAYSMAEAARAMRTATLSASAPAPRGPREKIGGVQVRIDQREVAEEHDLAAAVTAATAALATPASELVTVLYRSQEKPLEQAAAQDAAEHQDQTIRQLEQAAAAGLPAGCDAEISVYPGGAMHHLAEVGVE